MPLFTDGPLTTSVELQQYENNVLNVASAENIDITGKSRLAQDELAIELILFFDRNSLWDARLLVRKVVGLADVVVTEPLKRWHAYRTLAMIYEDAYNNQLNDRYQGKWTQYDGMSNNAAQKLFQVGVGIVSEPIAQAPAPSLTTIASGLTGATYYARASWVGTSGQEGSVSDAVQVTSGDGSAVLVGMSSPPATAASWNIYAGSDPDKVNLQNTSPLSINQTWMLPATGLISGRVPGCGQAPESWIVDKRILLRG